MNRARWLLPAGCLLVSLCLLPGCTEPIRTYEVPVTKQRLLGAIVFAQQDVWFFKLMGNVDDVAGQKEKFDGFIKSLRFPKDGKEPVTWAAPEGWEHEPGKGLRFASFRLPKNLEVTVFKFGPQQVLSNINRWREQLKLEPIEGEELFKLCKREKLEGGIEALVVDMESARYAPLREVKPPSARPAQGDGEFDYKTPAEWKQKPNPGPIARAAFTVEGGGKSAEVTLTPLAGGGGSISANINRWRGQVGLPEAGEEQLKKDAKVTKVDGQEAIQVELIGPMGKSMLAVICPAGGSTWFVKMMGDGELVAKQKAAFEEFVASLKFRGGN